MDHPQRKLTILSLQYYCYPDEVGGAWGLTDEINKRLVERGHKVFQITCKSSKSQPSGEVIDGIHYQRVSIKESKSFFSLWNVIRKQIKRWWVSIWISTNEAKDKMSSIIQKFFEWRFPHLSFEKNTTMQMQEPGKLTININ